MAKERHINVRDLECLFWTHIYFPGGPGSSVGIATDYGLYGPGIETLSLRDYLDFLRRARWKEYQHTPRSHMMGRYLDVL
jgi:hypothetical protein